MIACNTGPLIALAKIERLELLERLFGSVQIPPNAHHELLANTGVEAARLDEALARFIQVAPTPVLAPEVRLATIRLGAGEQHAIALTYELNGVSALPNRLLGAGNNTPLH